MNSLSVCFILPLGSQGKHTRRCSIQVIHCDNDCNYCMLLKNIIYILYSAISFSLKYTWQHFWVLFFVGSISLDRGFIAYPFISIIKDHLRYKCTHISKHQCSPSFYRGNYYDSVICPGENRLFHIYAHGKWAVRKSPRDREMKYSTQCIIWNTQAYKQVESIKILAAIFW